MPFLADAYLASPHVDASKSGKLGGRFIYHDQRANIDQLMQSSGSKDLDAAMLNAVAEAKFPVWPAGFATDDYTIGFWINGDD